MNYNKKEGYTASDAMNDALVKAGVSHVFVNTGTDYPPIIESWAKYEAEGLPKPEIIISPHESVAVSAAQGYAMATGRTQGVFVHVDVGTQNLGGALHNAYRCRVPVFVLAGLSPYTMEGELPGSRDSYIQFIQNPRDQAGIVRGYTKMECELKSGKNVQQMIYRSIQVAKSDPPGPVYMMATREALEEEGWDVGADMKDWAPCAPIGLDPDSVDILAEALAGAKNPLIITSYLGRNEDAVAELVALSDRLAIPVAESVGSYMNFPTTNPMSLGGAMHGLLGDADVILAIDCDLPWPPMAAGQVKNSRVFYLDMDPIKTDIPLWHIQTERSMKADSCVALRQLNAKLASMESELDSAVIEERRARVSKRHDDLRAEWDAQAQEGETMTSAFVASCIQEIMDDDTIFVNETITDRPIVDRYIRRTKPGTTYSAGGSSLGWFGGAAIGIKLAKPDKKVVAVASDGVYIFANPTPVYWMARRYNTPFLTVVFNNQGWNAPKMITKVQHPEGVAAKTGKFWASFQPAAQLDKIAEAAGGALAITVEKPSELRDALKRGQEAVENGTCAVINVMLPPV